MTAPLLDMCPCLAVNDSGDILLRDIIFATNGAKGSSICAKGTDAANVTFGQSREVVLFAPAYRRAACWRCMSALFRAVAHIVCRRTNPQVGRVAARWVVTRMTDQQPIRDWAAGKLVGHSVGKNLPAPNHYSAVTVLRPLSGPFPAITLARPIDLGPKARLNRRGMVAVRVPLGESLVPTLDIAAPVVRLSRHAGGAPTSALTNTITERPIIHHTLPNLVTVQQKGSTP